MLEEYDEKILDSRDKKKYRNKGKVETTVKAKTGIVNYSRRKYIEKQEDGSKKCVYLTDEILGIKELGLVSGGIIELIVQNISEVSYRVCAKMINNMTGLSISGVGVWNIVQKLGMTYEGWKQVAQNRYELVGKEYVAGYMSGEEIANITNVNLHSKYNMSQVDLRVLNSDGGKWIKKLMVSKTIYQADSYHLKEKINGQVRDTEDADKLKEMFWKKEYSQMIEYVEELKYKYDGEYEEVQKLEEVKKYLEKRKNSMKRYNEDEEVKKKLKRYSKKTGLKYRNMGCQESNNYCRLTRRMKHRRMSWSKEGSEHLAKVITTYASESCTDMTKYFSIQLLPESFVEYAERYIAEIEENIKEMKKQKVKTKKVYTFKQWSLDGYPQLKKILENKAISELVYR